MPKTSLSDEDLADALNGLYAYDTGSVDSGIHDNDLKARCMAQLKAACKPYQLYPDCVARIVRDAYLSEESIELGYGAEDAKRFLEWVEEEMHY